MVNKIHRKFHRVVNRRLNIVLTWERFQNETIYLYMCVQVKKKRKKKEEKKKEI